MGRPNDLSWEDRHPSNYGFKKVNVDQFLRSNMELREQIAKKCNMATYGDGCPRSWECCDEFDKEPAFEKADAILAIPDIKKALSLLERYRKGELVIVHEPALGIEQANQSFTMIPRKEGDMRPVDKNGFFI